VRVDVDRLLASLEIVPDARKSDADEVYARCPTGDHADSDASFHVRRADDEKRGLWSCWSCGASGNAAQLVMMVVGVGYGAARTWIEEHASSVESPQTPERLPSTTVEAPPLRRPFRLPPEVVLAPLAEWPTPARRYAQERRGIEGWQVDRWGLGHASGGRLDGRIVLPIRDSRGRVASYAARAYAGQPIRYLTPDAREGADPSVLFGEQHAWSFPAGSGVVVVEGALNALAVERVCEGPVLALGGTSGAVDKHGQLDPSVAAKLSRFRFVVCATDSDPAGDKAATAILRALSSYVPVARARLPEGSDPANAAPELLTTVLSEAVVDVW